MRVTKTIKEIYQAVDAIQYLVFHENLRNPFSGLLTENDKKRTLLLLANGPSLKSALSEFTANDSIYQNCDFFALNDFANSDEYTLLKPKHYVMSDPLFFVDTIYKERGHKVYDSLANKTTWKLNLFIPMYYKDSSFINTIKTNKNIHLVYFHSKHYAGNKKFIFWLYSKGLGNGEYGTVALNALYAALAMGYKLIKLYGVDHTFFGSLAVDANNRLCHKEEHFYESSTIYKPMRCHYPNYPDYFTMSMFLEEKMGIFKGHDIMAEWAQKIRARVINCTECSLIDSYEREIR